MSIPNPPSPAGRSIPPNTSFAVSVVGATTRNSVTVYHIQVVPSTPPASSPIKSWIIDRRYSEFKELHEMAKLRLPLSKIALFPKKKFFNNTPKVVESRRRDLSRYLEQLLLADPFCVLVSSLAVFLGIAVKGSGGDLNTLGGVYPASSTTLGEDVFKDLRGAKLSGEAHGKEGDMRYGGVGFLDKYSSESASPSLDILLQKLISYAKNGMLELSPPSQDTYGVDFHDQRSQAYKELLYGVQAKANAADGASISSGSSSAVGRDSEGNISGGGGHHAGGGGWGGAQQSERKISRSSSSMGIDVLLSNLPGGCVLQNPLPPHLMALCVEPLPIPRFWVPANDAAFETLVSAPSAIMSPDGRRMRNCLKMAANISKKGRDSYTLEHIKVGFGEAGN